MLNLVQIRNLIDAGQLERLIDRVLANGRSGNLALRLRLTLPEAIEPAAVGLGLQRACELAYGPAPALTAMAHRLVDRQAAGGMFQSRNEIEENQSAPATFRFDATKCEPEDPSISVAATAIALRALIDYRTVRIHASMPADPTIEAAIDRGLEALARRQGIDGTIGRDAIDDMIVLWQLGRVEAFRDAIRFADFIETVCDAAADHAALDLQRLALATAA